MTNNLVCACGWKAKTEAGLDAHRAKNWCGQGQMMSSGNRSSEIGPRSSRKRNNGRTRMAKNSAPVSPTVQGVCCPKCGSETRIRTAKKGSRAGHQFFGCVKWPSCDGTLDLKAVAPGGKTSDTLSQAPVDSKRSYSSADRNLDTESSANRTVSSPHEFPRVVSAASRTASYQAKHFQTISLPSRYVDALYDLEIERATQRSFAQWRLDYPISGIGVPRDLAPVFSVCESLINRGAIPYCSPGVEELALSHNRKQIDIGSLICDDSASVSVPLAMDVGESAEETQFFDMVTKHLTASGISGWSVIPQVQLSAINPEIGPGADNRCDFLLSHASMGAFIVEIDGAQHGDHLEVDERRNQLLADAGFTTLRIPVTELRIGKGPNLDGLFESLVNADPKPVSNPMDLQIIRLSRFAHQIQTALFEMIKGGWISSDDGPKVGLVGPQDLPSALLDDWATQAATDLVEMLRRCASLLGITQPIPTMTVEIIDQTPRDYKAYILPGDGSIDTTIYNPDAPKFFYADVAFPFEVSAPITATSSAAPSRPSIDDALWFLWYIFRKQEFWEGQWEVVERSLSRKDSVVLLPTGAGKSIAFQLSSLLLPGRCIVVDPIISLIEDQIDNLKKVGIDRSVGITSRLGRDSRQRTLSNLSAGQYLFCYVAPERFQTTAFREALRALTVANPVSLVVIDEAHCVSEWGHDFRTAYLNIGRVGREYCASGNFVPPIVALTGTASKIVLKDVQRELGIEDFEAIITPTSFDRQELNFDVLTCSSEEKQHRLRGFLERVPSDFGVTRDRMFVPNGNQTFAGMVFCPHVNGDYGVLAQAEFLTATIGTEVVIYSGSAPRSFPRDQWDEVRYSNARRFKRDEVSLIACTKAFGMGIDKPNVRYTVHIGVPQSIEAFYQEAGRAGRDRQRAQCAIILSNDNPARTDRLLNPSTSISEIADAVDEAGWDESDDIIRSLFFHKSAFAGIDIELDDLRKVTEELEPSSKRTRTRKVWGSRGGLERRQYEKALHRLVVLGVVADYSVDYASNEFDIVLSGASNDEVAESLGQYIGAYQSRLGREYENRARKISGDRKSDYIVGVGDLLIQFIYDHIEQSRRASMREMLNAASGAQNDGERLRRSILDYLEHAEFDTDINRLLQSDRGGLDEIGSLMDGITHPRDAATLRGAVAQAITSYPDVPALHLLRGLAEALDADGQPRIVYESIEAFVHFSVGSYGLTFDEIALALSECLSLEVLSADWKVSISEVATAAANEIPDLLRAFVRTFPSGASSAPTTALIAAYVPRIEFIVSKGVTN